VKRNEIKRRKRTRKRSIKNKGRKEVKRNKERVRK
jgi:hypothetical protein